MNWPLCCGMWGWVLKEKQDDSGGIDGGVMISGIIYESICRKLDVIPIEDKIRYRWLSLASCIIDQLITKLEKWHDSS